MTGLTILTERGSIEVPREVEAEGGSAVETFVAQQLGAPVATSAAPTPVTQSVTAAPAPLEHSEE